MKMIHKVRVRRVIEEVTEIEVEAADSVDAMEEARRIATTLEPMYWRDVECQYETDGVWVHTDD